MPLPVPLAPAVIAIHEEFEVAVQTAPLPAVTAIDLLIAPVDRIISPAGEKVTPPLDVTYAYAAPESTANSLGVLLIPNVELSSRLAPTITVSPLTAMASPKLSTA